MEARSDDQHGVPARSDAPPGGAATEGAPGPAGAATEGAPGPAGARRGPPAAEAAGSPSGAAGSGGATRRGGSPPGRASATRAVVPTGGTPPARMTGDGPTPGAAHAAGGGEGGVAGAVLDLVRTAVTAFGRAGSVSLGAVGDAVEAPGRALAGRIAANAVSRPRPVAERAALVSALSEQPGSPLLGGSTGAAVAAKVAGRVGPLRFLARRTPLWLVVTAVPALHASVTRGAEELALVASHLVHRTRAAGHEPHPDRVRRAAVQIVAGSAVDPDVEPRHAPLAVAWLQRALRATLPFSPGVGTRNPGALARAASTVEPSTLADDDAAAD